MTPPADLAALRALVEGMNRLKNSYAAGNYSYSASELFHYIPAAQAALERATQETILSGGSCVYICRMCGTTRNSDNAPEDWNDLVYAESSFHVDATCKSCSGMTSKSEYSPPPTINPYCPALHDMTPHVACEHLRTRLARLEEALTTYGNHLLTCAKWEDTTDFTSEPCTCGRDAALEGR